MGVYGPDTGNASLHGVVPGLMCLFS
jgi:hypothetical protein